MRSGFIITPSTTMSEPGTISAATIGNAADDGSAGTTTVVGRNSGRPTSVIRRPSPSGCDRDLGAEMGQHFLGVVARGLGLDHGRLARRVEAGEQDGRFDLRRGDGRAIFDRRGIARALEHDRAAPAFGLGQHLRRPSSRSGSRMRRIGRLRSEASPSKVAVIPWPPTTPIISRQPVPALPKSSVSRGGRQRADARAREFASARREPLDLGAERLAGLAGAAARRRPRAALRLSSRRRSAGRTERRDARSICRPAAGRRPLSGRARLALSGDAAE